METIVLNINAYFTNLKLQFKKNLLILKTHAMATICHTMCVMR